MIDLDKQLVIGLMSGTSLDGVDVVVARFEPKPQVLASHYLPFDEQIKSELFALNTAADNELHRTAIAANTLSHYYATAINSLLIKAGVATKDVAMIGNHGQTIRHRPECGYTLQIGNHALLAELTGIPVVADFRARDVAAGGQGAPLVPAFHREIFHEPGKSVAIFNVGGIANVTCLSADGLHVTGFDSGPGNALMDFWCLQHTGAPFDRDGAWGRSGRPQQVLLADWLSSPYFEQTPPKSTGRDLFNPVWLQSRDLSSFRPEDVQASLTMLTARSMADALRHYAEVPERLYLCGGGARNGYLVDLLKQLMPDTEIYPTDHVGVPADTLEAFAFAWLAWRFSRQLPGNLPAVTGAKGLRVLGALYPA